MFRRTPLPDAPLSTAPRHRLVCELNYHTCPFWVDCVNTSSMTTDACSVAAVASWRCAAPLNKVEDAEAFDDALVTRPAAPVFEASNDTTSADS